MDKYRASLVTFNSHIGVIKSWLRDGIWWIVSQVIYSVSHSNHLSQSLQPKETIVTKNTICMCHPQLHLPFWKFFSHPHPILQGRTKRFVIPRISIQSDDGLRLICTKPHFCLSRDDTSMPQPSSHHSANLETFPTPFRASTRSWQ